MVKVSTDRHFRAVMADHIYCLSQAPKSEITGHQQYGFMGLPAQLFSYGLTLLFLLVGAYIGWNHVL